MGTQNEWNEVGLNLNPIGHYDLNGCHEHGCRLIVGYLMLQILNQLSLLTQTQCVRPN
jgi:hypothetical protein